MIKRLSIEQLKPGMFVIDTGLCLDESSTLYSEEGEIQSPDQIQAIMAKGFSEVFVDSDKGSYYSQNPGERERISDMYADLREDDSPEQQDATPQKRRPKADQPAAPSVPLHEEVRRMEKDYVASLDMVRTMYDDFKSGDSINIKAADGFVDSVIDSLDRNCRAYVSLVKLRQYDDYSFTHSLNVAVLAVSFGRYLKLPRNMLRLLGLGGLFHDVGKLKVSLSVLNKPGKLTPREFEHMQRHPELGREMLEVQGGLEQEVLMAAYEHHEKYSGEGYPRKLAFAGISKAALIVSLADVYDALTSERPYKGALSQHQALGIMYNMRNKDFHPVLVDKFIKYLGVYPLGTLVKLRNGLTGVVHRFNAQNPMRPTIKILPNGHSGAQDYTHVPLSQERYIRDSQYQIVECLTPGALKMDAAQLME